MVKKAKQLAFENFLWMFVKQQAQKTFFFFQSANKSLMDIKNIIMGAFIYPPKHSVTGCEPTFTIKHKINNTGSKMK